MKTLKIYLLILLSLQLLPLAAQYYETGQDPASLKWEKISTEHFLFIFPESYRAEAARASQIYENAYSILYGTLNNRPLKKLPVIFHNYSVESNGYVAWAPRRLELFPLSPQDNLPMGDQEQLALHEITHLVQMQSLYNGVSVPLSYLLGEQYIGALGIYTPFWFLEGNAVISESVYSESGRGRVPVFEKQMKALLLEKGDYSYDKMINGSFRDHVPDHYQFGYQMSAWAIASLGSDIWSDVMLYTARNPYSVNPFNLALRKKYNITKKQVYEETIKELSIKWGEEDRSVPKMAFDTLNCNKEGKYASYFSPVKIDNDRIAAIKTTLTGIPEIVLINSRTGEESTLHKPGYTYPYRISYANSLLTWAENRYDPRWSNRGYSVIMLMELETGKVKQLSAKSRYFSPSLSEDGSRIVVSESTPENINSIVILDSKEGSVLGRFSIGENIMPLGPVWKDTETVIFISHSNRGEGIISLNTSTGTSSVVLPQGRDDLESIAVTGDTILFTSSFSGIDNVFAILPGNGKAMVTSSRFGVSDISACDNELLFSDYSADGNCIGRIKITGNNMIEIPLPERKVPFPVGLIDSETKLDSPDRSDYSPAPASEPYRKWQHLFNFHSWMPFWYDINNISTDNLAVSPGVTIMSQNHLSTMISTLGYEYTGGDHLLHSSLLWKGWYPAVELDMTWGGTPAIIQDPDNGTEPSVIYPGLSASGAIYLPLHFNSGRFNQTLWPYFRLSYSNNYFYHEDGGYYDYGQALAASRLYFSNLHRMARRDIWPRWGQVIDLNHLFSPTDSDLYGPVTSARLFLYFPGVARNHSVKLSLQAEKKEFRKLLITNRISLPRGYRDVIPEEVTALSLDYTMPLTYPDFNFGPLIYLQRLRATLFYDYAEATRNYYYVEREMVEGTKIFSSYGTEILADFYLLRIPFRFSSGVQAAWMPQKNKPYFGFLFNIDIFGFVIGGNGERQLQ